MSLTLKSCQLRNFGSVSNSAVQFPAQGFVLVTGQNRTSEGMFESVGSGKSLLGEAVSRALFGIPGRFTRYGQYSKNGEGDTLVTVEAEINGQPLVVRHGYKCRELNPSGEGLDFCVGSGAPTSYGDIDDTKAALAEIVGVQPNVAGWTIFIDGSRLDFSRLSETQAINLIMGALNQPPWTEYHAKAKKVSAKYTAELELNTKLLDAAKSNLQTAEFNVASAERRLAEAQQQLDRSMLELQQRREKRAQGLATAQALIESKTARIEELKRLIKESEKREAEEFAAVALSVSRARSAVAVARQKLERATQALVDGERAMHECKHGAATARVKWRDAEYARLNADRTARQLQIQEEARNHELLRRKWQTQLSEKTTAFNSAQSRHNRAGVELVKAKMALQNEESVPSTCPLAGCGRAWPKTNEAQIAAAKQRSSRAESELTIAEKALEVATSELDQLKNSEPQALVVAEVPPETPIGEWPGEEEYRQRLEELAQSVIWLTAAKDAVKAEVGPLEQEVVRLEGIKAPLSSAKIHSEELAGCQAAIDGARKLVSDIQLAEAQDAVDDREVVAASARVEQLKEVVRHHRSDTSRISIDVGVSQELLQTSNYWVEAYGPTGIPNRIVTEAVAPLNEISKRISHKLTAGILEVQYSTARKLASGVQKSEITARMINKFGAGDGSSKGESGLLNLIIAETLAEIGGMPARVRYRWYDEAATSQDAVIRRSIFSSISEQARRYGILTFVVDHSVEVSSYADQILIAEKTSAGTSYIWG